MHKQPVELSLSLDLAARPTQKSVKNNVGSVAEQSRAKQREASVDRRIT